MRLVAALCIWTIAIFGGPLIGFILLMCGIMY